MLLRPTEEELKTASELGIDPVGMNGPKLREAIHKAQRLGVRPSIRRLRKYRALVHAADLLGIPIDSGDGVTSVMKRVEEHLMAIYSEKGIHSNTKIDFTSEYSSYEGKEVTVKSTNIIWRGYRPQLSIIVAGKKHFSFIAAVNVALYAFAS